MEPVIGVIPLYDEEKDSYWMVPGYMKMLEKCGAIPVILPMSTDEKKLRQIFQMCNGILFTGGHDVGPDLYRAKVSDRCGVICKERDQMESFLLDLCMTDGIPALGICRGIQLMNAHFGGTLYQDLPTEYPCEAEHHMQPPYNRTAHKIEVYDNTLLSDIIGAGIHGVNSYHHQAVKEVAPEAEVMAVSSDGLVEAINIVGHPFMVGVQWHPEFSYETDPDCMKLVQAFVNACK